MRVVLITKKRRKYMVTSEEFKNISKKKRSFDDDDSDNKITEQIELMTELMKVTSALKSNITQDYPLAHLNKDEREFIVENYQNAEFAKEIIRRFGIRGYKYVWDDAKKDWVRGKDNSPAKVRISDIKQKYIIKLGDRTFEFFMVKPHMIAILNRNRAENFLVKLLGKAPEEEQPQTVGQLDERSFFQKIADKMRGREVEYEEE